MPKIPLNRAIIRIWDNYPMIFGRRNVSSDVENQWPAEKSSDIELWKSVKSTPATNSYIPRKKYVVVKYLTKDTIHYPLDAKVKGQEIFEESCKFVGLLDTDLFGLAIEQDGVSIFIDLDLKISKYASKSWKSSPKSKETFFVLHLKVKYYIDCHLLINENTVRRHYYLQLRENVKNYWQLISEDKAFLLAALALQADLGTYNPETHKGTYFEIGSYFPPWVIQKLGVSYIVKNIPLLHRDNAGMCPAGAQQAYMKAASDISAPHNMHMYTMKRKKTGKTLQTVHLGIKSNGIHIYEQKEGHPKSLLSIFHWCDIAKLHFEKKKFEVICEREFRKFIYFAPSEDVAKHLLMLCQTTHQFHLANFKRAEELLKYHGPYSGLKNYRESYIYTDEKDKAQEQKQSQSYPKFGNGLQSPIELKSWNRNKSNNCEKEPLPKSSNFSTTLKFKSKSTPALHNHLEKTTVDLWPPADDPFKAPSQASAASSLFSTDSLVSQCTSNWVKCDSFEELPIEKSPKLKLPAFDSKKITNGNKNAPNPHIPASNQHKPLTQSSSFNDFSPHSGGLFQEQIQESPVPVSAVRRKKCEAMRSPSFNLCLTGLQSHSEFSFTNNALQQSTLQGVKLKTAASRPRNVLRSPSFNLCASDLKVCSPIAHQKIYSVSQIAQQVAHSMPHIPQETYQVARKLTKTRIGVSSLGKDRRLSLALSTPQQMQCSGSEPNIFNLNPMKNNPNCRSEMNLPDMSVQSGQWAGNEMNFNRFPQHNHNSYSEVNLSSCYGRGEHNPNSYSEANLSSCYRKNDINLDVLDSGMIQQMQIAARNQLMQLQRANNANQTGRQLLKFQKNSKSEMCLHSPQSEVQQMNSRSEVNLPDACADFPFLPPPMEYRNAGTNENTAKKGVDLVKLAECSRSMDLPLITALCNDRMLLPRTTPHHRRQPERFVRTTSLPNEENNSIPKSIRPFSWHVEPTSDSWENNITSHRPASWDNAAATNKNSPSTSSELKPWDIGYSTPASENTYHVYKAPPVGSRSSADSGFRGHFPDGSMNYGLSGYKASTSFDSGISDNGLPSPKGLNGVSDHTGTYVPPTSSLLYHNPFSIANGSYIPYPAQEYMRLVASHTDKNGHKTNISQHGKMFSVGNGVELDSNRYSLPPTILTSFSGGQKSNSYAANSYHYEKTQLIPTKLSALASNRAMQKISLS